jgi:heterodisulfide reductase subunit B
MDEILKQLGALAVDLYQEGYHCGWPEDPSGRWTKAWAEAMRRVAGGEPYTQNLVIDIFNEGR